MITNIQFGNSGTGNPIANTGGDVIWCLGEMSMITCIFLTAKGLGVFRSTISTATMAKLGKHTIRILKRNPDMSYYYYTANQIFIILSPSHISISMYVCVWVGGWGMKQGATKRGILFFQGLGYCRCKRY